MRRFFQYIFDIFATEIVQEGSNDAPVTAWKWIFKFEYGSMLILHCLILR